MILVIDLIDNWMLESSQNFTIIVGITMVLYIGSVLVLSFIGKKLGKPDEGTNGIYPKVIYCMFTTQIIMNIIFLSSVDRNIEYFRQFFILFQGIPFLIGAIYALRLYRKDFK